jgi:hypothetical protein
MTMEALLLFVFVSLGLAVGIKKLRQGAQKIAQEAGLHPEAGNVVKFDECGVSVSYANGETRKIAWPELSMVGITTTDEGPFFADVFWGLHGSDGKVKVVYPGGSTGEREMLLELQRRLDGFDNEELIRAMGSVSNASFLIWKEEEVMQ